MFSDLFIVKCVACKITLVTNMAFNMRHIHFAYINLKLASKFQMSDREANVSDLFYLQIRC